MTLEPPFRPATREDSYRIAELFRICSGGVADYVWSTMADDYPGLSLTEIGARRYAREDITFSYRNCVVADLGGEVVAMLVAFPIAAPAPAAREPDDRSDGEEEHAPGGYPDVLAPYAGLEVPGSYYICGMAVLPEHRNRGLGGRLLAIARTRARERGLGTLSLLAFEQNRDAIRLYERNGFVVIDRRPVVPHELIHYTGDVLLMAAGV